MLKEIIRYLTLKSIGTDLVKMAVRAGHVDREDVLREKLGVSSIDEFMRMKYQGFKK